MKYVAVTISVIVLLAMLGGANADICTITGNCNDCLKVGNGTQCNWVADCVHPAPAGALRQHRCVLKTDPVWAACPASHTCDCSQYFACDLCVRDRTCQWCPGATYSTFSSNGTCLSTASTCPATGGAASDSCQLYCHYASNCTSCQSMGNYGCGWCDATDSCVEPEDLEKCSRVLVCPSSPTPPSPPHTTCPHEFDAGSFFGGIALAVGLALVGFFGFRWYSGRQRSQDYGTLQ